MEIWGLWIFAITGLLSLGLLFSYYFITKSRADDETKLIEKSLKNSEFHHTSMPMTTSQFAGRPPHQIQKDLSESFIDLRKDPNTSTVIASTNILDRSRIKGTQDLIPKSGDRDRSIDLLLLANTGRNGGYRKKRKSISHPNSIEIDPQVVPIKIHNDIEKVQPSIKHEILRIEKEITSQSRFSLFRSHIGKEFHNYNFMIALLSPQQQCRPFRYHMMLNCSFYITLLFGLSILIPKFGEDYFEKLNSIIFSGLYLVALLPFLFYSYKSVQDNHSLSIDLAYNTQLSHGEDPFEDKILGIISTTQTNFFKDTLSKLFVTVGLAAGIVTFSRIPQLEVLLTKPLLLGFLLLVALDVFIIRNLMIIATTFIFKSQLQQTILHEKIIELIKTGPQATTVTCANEGVTKLFTVQQEFKEELARSEVSVPNIFENSYIPKEQQLLENHRTNEKPKNDKNIVLTTDGNDSSEPEHIECFRNRLMSFSEKERCNSEATQNENNGIQSITSLHEKGDIVSVGSSGRDKKNSIPRIRERNQNIEKPVKVSLKETFRNKFKDFEVNKGKEEFVFAFSPKDEKKGRSSEKKKKFESSLKKNVPSTTSVEILMNLDATSSHRTDVKNPENRRESPSKHQIQDSESLSQERNIGVNNQESAPDIIKIKSLLYPANENWADSLLGERKKEDCVIPNLGAKKGSILTSQTGTTMNSARDYDSHKSHNRSLIGQDQRRGKALQLDGPDSYHPSFGYLEQHDKSSQVGLRMSEYASALTSRHSIGTESQCEFKNDLENLVKYLTKDKNTEGKPESEVGDYDSNTFECRLSHHESQGKNNRSRALQERKNQQSKENSVELSRQRSSSYSKKAPWLGGYDISLHQFQHQQSRRVLPTSTDNAKARIQYQEIGKMTINKINQTRDLPSSGMNVEKMNEVSKSYGYRMQHNGPASREREISFDKLKSRKCISVEKPREDMEINSKQSRNSVAGYEDKSYENKKVIRSLNQVHCLPKAKSSSKSQVLM